MSNYTAQRLQEQSNREAAESRQRQEILNKLYQMALGYDDSPVGRLNLPDSRFLDEDFLGSLRPHRGQDLLLALAGQESNSSPATSQLAALAQQQAQIQAEEDRRKAEAIANIVNAGFSAYQNSQAGGGANQGASALDIYNQFSGDVPIGYLGPPN